MVIITEKDRSKHTENKCKLIYFIIISHTELGLMSCFQVLARKFSKQTQMFSNIRILPLIPYSNWPFLGAEVLFILKTVLPSIHLFQTTAMTLLAKSRPISKNNSCLLILLQLGGYFLNTLFLFFPDFLYLRTLLPIWFYTTTEFI